MQHSVLMKKHTQYFVYICISSLRSRERFDAVGLIVKSAVVNTLYSPHPRHPFANLPNKYPCFRNCISVLT